MAGIGRLKRRAEFLRVASGRRKWVAPGLILQVARRQDETPSTADREGPAAPCVGFTASRKVGIAVARNRARRRLKAAVEQVLPLHAAPGHDYVVIARTETLRRPFTALKDDLETALKRLGVYRDRAEPAGER
jgi:ribonuclease P protein component